MKLILAWTWLGLIGASFLAFMAFMLMQIPLEVWLFIGLMAGFATFFGITIWAVKQIDGYEED